MKTIVHIELSDLDRNDLARRIDRDPDTKRLVTRKEVTEHMLALIDQEITDGRFEDGRDEIQQHPDGDKVRARCGSSGARGDDSAPPPFTPSRGDEEYLAQPKDTGIAAACSRILDDAALISAFAWDTVERNRKK